MKIIFFGTSSFASKILVKLLQSTHQIVAIVTRPDRSKGRHLQYSFPPVKEVAQKLRPDIPLFQPEKASTPEFASQLQHFQADLFVVVAYGEIIKKNLLDIPKFGCINIHASLLPKFRGAAPIQRCLMAGEKETGITIIEMSPQMDAGDILAMESIPIPSQMNFGELESLLCELGGKLLFDVLEQFQQGTIVKIPQNHALATLAPKILPEEEWVDWNKPAEVLHHQIRALSPSPGASSTLLMDHVKKRLKIKKAEVVERSGAPGTILSFGNEGFIVACGEKALRLLEVQLEGKKTMDARDFIRGIHHPVAMQV